MGIICKEMPVEVYWVLGKIKYLYRPLRRVFEILKAEISYCIDDKIILQMAIKALNDTVGLNGIILTLLVFRAYL
jgi:hypothetical protein